MGCLIASECKGAMLASSKRLEESIRKVLAKVEQTSGLPTNDPALVALRDLLRRRLRELKSGLIQRPRDWTRGRFYRYIH
jgi:hypothetical protein